MIAPPGGRAGIAFKPGARVLGPLAFCVSEEMLEGWVGYGAITHLRLVWSHEVEDELLVLGQELVELNKLLFQS